MGGLTPEEASARLNVIERELIELLRAVQLLRLDLCPEA